MTERDSSDDGVAPNGRLCRLLAEAYDQCADGLFRYAAVILADPSAAEDVVQQVFARLAGRGKLDDIPAMAAYLRRAVRNECYSLLRHRSRHRHAGDERVLVEPLPAGEPPVDGEVAKSLEKALRSLPPQQREVVHMKVYEKMTFQQIARAVAVSVNTAASRYRYALAHLRKLLGPCLENDE